MLEHYLLSFLYGSALYSQRLARNYLKVQKKSWASDVEALRRQLIDLGTAL